jgi:osmotically-inducible protein OsmY
MKLVKMNASKKNETDQLLESVKSRIKWDSRLSNSDVIVKIKNGEVQVTGFFDSATKKNAILDILKTTKGVTKFSDYTQIVPNRKRADSEIKKILSKKIHEFFLFEGERIDIKVTRGEVLYQGVVYRRNLKAFASRLAWELSGVNDCTNLIKIKKTPRKKAGAYYLSLPVAA